MNCISGLATDFQARACHTLSINSTRTLQVPLLTPPRGLESTVGLHLKKVSVRGIANTIFFDLFLRKKWYFKIIRYKNLIFSMLFAKLIGLNYLRVS